LTITGKPKVDAIVERIKPSLKDVFIAGFQGEPIDGSRHTKTPPPDPTGIFGDPDPFGGDPPDDPPDDRATDLPVRDHLQIARAYAQGVKARRRHPDFKQRHPLLTGSDGSVQFPLDLSRTDYRYVLKATRTDKQLDAARLTNTQLEFHPNEAPPDKPKAVVWLARPIHRPGSTVQFKGIVRQFNGLRVADHDPTSTSSVEVTVRTDRETLWQGRCEVSEAGTFCGSFKIPPTAELGPYFFNVDGTASLAAGGTVTAPSIPLQVAEYRLPTYQVELSLPKRKQAGGEPMEASAEVRYFTGKPAIGAEVELALETGEHDPPTVVGLTGKDGRVKLSLPLPQVEDDRQFAVRATVMDASGQTYSQSGQVSVVANAFQVSVHPEKYEVTLGETIRVEVHAKSWQGEPIAGATVVIDGTKESAATDESGSASLSVKATATDVWQSMTVAVVADGKVVRNRSTSITVLPKRKPTDESEQTQTPEQPKPEDAPPKPFVHFRSVPSQIDAGDPLEFTLDVGGRPERRNLVALFAENTQMLHTQVLRLPPGLHRLTIPTRSEWAPSLTLTATLFDGSRINVRSHHCYLRPTEKFLTLAIETDCDQYKPGRPCVALITATGHDGRPIPRAEISLGVVDEAVYELMRDPTPDLHDFFYRYHLPHLCSGHYDCPAPECETLWYWLGPRYAWGHYEVVDDSGSLRALGARYGGCGMARRSAKHRIRRRFQETAHWVADLVTDEQGRTRTTFELPDNLTNWRFTARGVTADTKVGEIRVQRRTFLPLQVELALPRSFRQADRIELPVVLHNNADRVREVRGTVRIGDDKQRPWKPRSLDALATGRLTVPIHATAAGPIPIFASIRDSHGKAGDAIEKNLIALPRGHRFTQCYSGPLSKAATVRIEAGGTITDHGLTLRIRRESGLAGPVCSALDDLIQYPYGCVEQTMSRFMPAVVAGKAIAAAGVENPAAARLPEVITKGLARLADFQHDDGGWGWWKDDATNDFMTAYVLEGLSRCRRQDRSVPERMIDRAAKYLAGQLRNGNLQGHRPGSVGNVNLAVYASHALATLYEQDRQRYRQGIEETETVLRSIEDSDVSLGAIDRILLADVWRMLAADEWATKILAELSDQVRPVRGDRGTIVATGALLEVGVAIAPDDDRWPRLARQLVLARQAASWGDTLTNAAAVRGLAAVLATTKKQEAVPVVVRVDGERVGVLGRADGNTINLQRPHVGVVTLHPARPGSGDFYGIRLEGYLERPPANPRDPAVTLRSRVFRLQPERQELMPGATGRLRVPRGVTLEVLAEVELKRAISHARLTIPRPCGMELVRPPKTGQGIVATEQRDEALHFFIDHWLAGTHRINFLVRAELDGTVSVPVAELVPMYDDPLPVAVHAASEWVVQGEDE